MSSPPVSRTSRRTSLSESTSFAIGKLVWLGDWGGLSSYRHRACWLTPWRRWWLQSNSWASWPLEWWTLRAKMDIQLRAGDFRLKWDFNEGDLEEGDQKWLNTLASITDIKSIQNFAASQSMSSSSATSRITRTNLWLIAFMYLTAGVMAQDRQCHGEGEVSQHPEHRGNTAQYMVFSVSDDHAFAWTALCSLFSLEGNAVVERSCGARDKEDHAPLDSPYAERWERQEEFFDDFKTRVETLDVRATKIFKICCGDVRHHILMSPRHQDQDWRITVLCYQHQKVGMDERWIHLCAGGATVFFPIHDADRTCTVSGWVEWQHDSSRTYRQKNIQAEGTKSVPILLYSISLTHEQNQLLCLAHMSFAPCNMAGWHSTEPQVHL